MSEVCAPTVIEHSRIDGEIRPNAPDATSRVREVLAKAREMHGLNEAEVAVLMRAQDPELISELFDSARQVKEAIYGSRLVIFTPLYVSNLCCNDCSYCAFRSRNRQIHRHALSQQEIAQETRALIDQGHKRVLLVAGEAYPKRGFDYVLDAIDTIYATKHEQGEIRRININVAPLKTEEFKQLKAKQIGTYQLFQETYHRPTYSSVHVAGPKTDYDWRISAMDRAMEAGIDDIGIGVLFGLHDWRYEIMALIQHANHLEAKYGAGPHTISVPRLEPANGSDMASHPPHPVSDHDFKRIVAILRLAVPYTGIIMSTRETAKLRRDTFALGVSQISAGSRTTPGGYSTDEQADDDTAGQFSLGDHRPLDEVVRDVCELGYLPSFCTACYRLGRTGADFMDHAKPGEIKLHCSPNALCTLQEYLNDYASPATRAAGEKLITEVLAGMPALQAARAAKLVELVKLGGRDVFC